MAITDPLETLNIAIIKAANIYTASSWEKVYVAIIKAANIYTTVWDDVDTRTRRFRVIRQLPHREGIEWNADLRELSEMSEIDVTVKIHSFIAVLLDPVADLFEDYLWEAGNVARVDGSSD